MLHERDYLLRLIEQLGQALSRLMERILDRSGDGLPEVEVELAAVARKAGLDLQLARSLAPDSLHLIVAPGGSLSPSRCWLLAELLFLHGLHWEGRGDGDEARRSLVRSLALYRLAEPEWSSDISLPDPDQRVRELELRLGGKAPPRHW